tara:strand:+ start:1781 stop:2353 length:573 start_codon:yes stop_codon:yes gene_type:complete
MPNRVERLKKRGVKAAAKTVYKMKKAATSKNPAKRTTSLLKQGMKKQAKIVKKIVKTNARVAKPKRTVTYSTSSDGNSRKKTVTSRGGKKTKVVNYTYTAPGKNSPGNQKTTTVTKKGKKGTSTKTKTKTQGSGKLKRLVQSKQRGRIVKKAIKAGTNKAGVTADSYQSNGKARRTINKNRKLYNQKTGL